MATIPTEDEVKKLQSITEEEIEKKVDSQAKIGKEFILPDGGGSGVMPEEVWKNLPGRIIQDEKAVI